LDSDPDAIEFALWSAVKHLRQATDEIEDVGEKNLSDYFPVWTPTRSAMMKDRMMKTQKKTTSSLKSELEKTESLPI
jgi:hypothetical protein